MDYSEIIIYIIVISIIFISSFKKKKTAQAKPENTERPQKRAANIPQPVIPNKPPSPPQAKRMIIEYPDNVTSTGSIQNLNKTARNISNIPDSKPDIYNDVSKNTPGLNREELRKAIITYEILKKKF